MRFSILAVLVVVMLGLAPCTAFASGGGGEGEKKEGEKKEGEAKSGGDAEVIGGKFAGDPVYVRLKPIVLPVISDAGAEQLVNLIVHLETKDLETATFLNSNKPRLNDAIIRALYGGLADGSMRNANALDIMKVKNGIRETVNATFGAGSVKDVLIQAVEQRKF